jgi:shikimate dehydrogenase
VVPPTRLVILGDPVSQSRSPKIQSAAIAAAGFDVKYEALRVLPPELARVVRQLRDEGAGGNVTVPHKIAFRSLCAEVTTTADRTGAVNTFWTRDGALFGDNTDVAGFDAAARQLLGGTTAGATVAVIGAGGAAAAVLAAIEMWPGARARIFTRNPQRAQTLAARFGDCARVVSTVAEALADSTFVVNATPIGMTDDSLPFAIEDLAPKAIVMDLVYNTAGTGLSRAAAAAGHVAADGTAMLIEQAALAFERWFGFAPDRDVMRAALV